jgi:hypothetical protein
MESVKSCIVGFLALSFIGLIVYLLINVTIMIGVFIPLPELFMVFVTILYVVVGLVYCFHSLGELIRRMF